VRSIRFQFRFQESVLYHTVSPAFTWLGGQGKEVNFDKASITLNWVDGEGMPVEQMFDQIFQSNIFQPLGGRFGHAWTHFRRPLPGLLQCRRVGGREQGIVRPLRHPDQRRRLRAQGHRHAGRQGVAPHSRRLIDR